MSDIAVGKPAQQSSTYSIYVAEMAVDGNRSTDLRDNSCSHTDDIPNSWWRVDLQAVYYISRVRLLNRGLDKFGHGLCLIFISFCYLKKEKDPLIPPLSPPL